MCGRYSFVASKEKIQQQLGTELEVGANLRINFNVAPTQHSYVITNDKPQTLQYITWGLIPYWSRDNKIAGKLINARREGIESKPSFRVPIRKKRCLVLADSFYEWKKVGTKKIPYRIMLKNGDLLLLAGIWDVWYDDQYAVKSFSIITTAPSQDMQGVHDRMPVILNHKQDQEKWLEDIPLEEALSLLQTPENGILEMYRVSDKVNSVKNNSPDLHQRISDSPTLF
ncbi:MAG: SOS response-associated peptidase [Saprospiraceae bacterium]|nr:SOS response-associated peptidase [Lewinella sp.]